MGMWNWRGNSFLIQQVSVFIRQEDVLLCMPPSMAAVEGCICCLGRAGFERPFCHALFQLP